MTTYRRKPSFNSKQREILRELYKSRMGLTTYGISQRTGISWTTVKKHVNSLQRKQVINCAKSPYSSKNLCRINWTKIYGKKKR